MDLIDTATHPQRQIRSVNAARARRIDAGGKTVMSAICKQAVSGEVRVERIGLVGDEQADLTVHGGLDKAVYAYPGEHYPFWQQARQDAGVLQASLLDDELAPGALGENLTLSGLLEDAAWIGDRLVFPDCELQVSEPRYPCFKFVAVMGFGQAAKLMAREANCGFYLRVTRTGTLAAGQAFELKAGPRQTRIDEFFRTKMAGRR